jgi:hypothetical protein
MQLELTGICGFFAGLFQMHSPYTMSNTLVSDAENILYSYILVNATASACFGPYCTGPTSMLIPDPKDLIEQHENWSP